jgi:transcriptional regulator with XRE-family HTH domain
MQTIIAHMQPVKRQTYAVPSMPVRRYAGTMQAEQKTIADWMGRVQARKGWTGEEWARRAGVSTSTVTRAQSEGYSSVTAVLTLDRLARAAGVPSILEYLRNDTPPTLPSEAVLSALFLGMLRGTEGRCDQGQRAELLAKGLIASVELLARNPAIEGSPFALTATAEAVTMTPRRPGTDR